jgi:hypothetical protein
MRPRAPPGSGTGGGDAIYKALNDIPFKRFEVARPATTHAGDRLGTTRMAPPPDTIACTGSGGSGQ